MRIVRKFPLGRGGQSHLTLPDHAKVVKVSEDPGYLGGPICLWIEYDQTDFAMMSRRYVIITDEMQVPFPGLHVGSCLAGNHAMVHVYQLP